MKIHKFIDNVKDFLNLDDFTSLGKKKSIQNLLKKLEKREKETKAKLEKNIEKKEKKKLKEELEITILHIKKGKKLLEKLENK